MESPSGIAPSVLELLEFPKIVDWLAGLTGAPTSAARARALVPSTDAAQVKRALAELLEGKRLAETRGPWPGPPPFALVDEIAEELRLGAALGARSLFQVAELLSAGGRAARWWEEAREEARNAARLAEGLIGDPELEKRLRLAVDADGGVLDGASAELAALRKQQNVERARLREKLDRYRSLAAEEGSFVTQRSDRFVVAVRADRFERSKGLVHDVSASGATLFVEPFEVCALNNTLAELAARERTEIGRVLRALSDLVRGRIDALRASEEALAATDLLWARVRLSRAMAGTTPTVVAGGEELRLPGARHPLLWRDARGDTDPATARSRVVPATLELRSPARILLVSGPNMGGKTVALKAVGLAALLAQAGLDVPCGEGAILPLFTTVFADIGDAQSIELHLSTFAAHLARLDAMARAAHPAALFLVDEIGSGTDPAEGASLGRALLRHFARQGAWAVATTHLGSLKVLAQEEKAVVNGSMALDPETLAPRYELIVGVPGGSHALAVAERLGFHPGVLAEARKELPEAARSLEALLGDVARELARAQDAREGFERAQAEAEERAGALEREREAHVADRKRADKDRLLQVRALEGQVQALLREARAEAKSEEKSKARIQELETRARGLGRESDRLLATPAAGGRPAVFTPGATVWVRDLGVTARVVSGPDADGKVVLERGAWRIQSRADQCFAPEEAAASGAGVGAGAGAGAGATARRGATTAAALPEVEAGLTVDVRGLDAEDALRRVDDGLDRAVVAGLADLRIVHGVGKGVLREAIARALKAHPHVAGQRLGGHGEGGRGVTIVSLR
jgi:DNA mismatch repair protein MutS2